MVEMKGKLYALAGCPLDYTDLPYPSFEEYDPTTQQWSTLRSLFVDLLVTYISLTDTKEWDISTLFYTLAFPFKGMGIMINLSASGSTSFLIGYDPNYVSFSSMLMYFIVLDLYQLMCLMNSLNLVLILSI